MNSVANESAIVLAFFFGLVGAVDRGTSDNALHIPPPVQISITVQENLITFETVMWSDIFEEHWKQTAEGVDRIEGAELKKLLERSEVGVRAEVHHKVAWRAPRPTWRTPWTQHGARPSPQQLRRRWRQSQRVPRFG